MNLQLPYVRVLLGGVIAALLWTLMPLPAHAVQTYYFRNTTGESCGVGTDELDLSTTQGSSETSKALTTTGHSWNVAETARDIQSGNWQVCWDNTHSNSGGNRQVSILLRRMNSSCVAQETIINESVNPNKGATAEICSAATAAGTISFSSGDILLLELTANSDGHNTVNYDGGTTSGDSRITFPDAAASVDAPTVFTQFTGNINASEATLFGRIADNGGEDASNHGFAYSTDSTLETGVTTTTLGSFTGTGEFSERIGSLSSDTAYFFRAFAANSAGTSTGSIRSFSTGNNTVVRTMRLFKDYTIKFLNGRIVLYSR